MYRTTKRGKQREEALQNYMDGKLVSFNVNQKGLHELYSPDGLKLYYYDYLLLKKTSIKMNGKTVLLVNEYPSVPTTAAGTPASMGMQHVRRLVSDCLSPSKCKNYEIIYQKRTPDMSELDLTGVITKATYLIYNFMNNNSYWTGYMQDTYLREWNGNLTLRIKRTLSLLKYLRSSTGISCTHKSLQDVGKNIKPRWAALHDTIVYWVVNGMKYTEKDDTYAKKAPKPIRAAYTALGGKEPVLKDKETGMLLLRVMSPGTPVDELPLYMGTSNKCVQEVIRQRLKRGI